MLSFHRDYNEIPYWLNNNLWLKFLINDDFDHTYFIDIFKTIVEDYMIRNEVLEYFLCRNDDDHHHNHEGVSIGFNNDYYYHHHNHNHNQEISNRENHYHHLLSSSSTILFNKYYPKQSQTQRLVEIQRIWKLSKSVNKIAYITYEYPGIIVDQTG